MSFTTPYFLFLFLLLFFAVYFIAVKAERVKFLTKLHFSEIVLLLINLCFYAWSGLGNLALLVVYVIAVYITGRLIEKNKSRKITTVYVVSLVITVVALAWFRFLGPLRASQNSAGFIAPLGISFITFTAISYLADVYNGKARAGSFLDCALFITFFPKIVSGPISLWRDFEGELREKKITLNGFSDGCIRFMIGASKKLILADTFGMFIANAANAVDVPTAWIIAGMYMLQLYFDFSGYSDMAIGLSLMFGFRICENFDYPYLSCSISEFWRRWHISLGRWFREYVYIPLGGNRCGNIRTYINLGIVFLLTGLWHGVSWTFLLWGALNGLFCIIERAAGKTHFYESVPKVLKWGITTVIVFFLWELFRFNDFSSCVMFLRIMFGRVHFDSIPYTWVYYMDRRIITLVVIGIITCTVTGLEPVKNLRKKIGRTVPGSLLKTLVCSFLFLAAIAFMINSSYSPFLYFQF